MDRSLTLFPLDTVAVLLERIGKRLIRRPATMDPDQIRARRDQIKEMLDRCPDAFSSDFDIEAVMTHYPRNF